MFDSSTENDDTNHLERAGVYGVVCDTLRGSVWPPGISKLSSMNMEGEINLPLVLMPSSRK